MENHAKFMQTKIGKMNFEITGGVPEGYKATGYRKVKKGELYLIVCRERNYSMKWHSYTESFVEVIILEKIKPVDDKC